MILAPTSGALGIQPHGVTTRCVNRSGGTLAIGDVVVTSFAHTSPNAVYPPTSIAEQSQSPFACVVKADGTLATVQAGYLGVVVGLGAQAGASLSEVDVQFGGIVKAKVAAVTAAVVMGSQLAVDDTAGQFGNAAATPSTYGCAIALEGVAIAATETITVLVRSDLWFAADV